MREKNAKQTSEYGECTDFAYAAAAGCGSSCGIPTVRCEGRTMFDKIEPQKKGKGSVGDERYYGTDNETLDHRI